MKKRSRIFAPVYVTMFRHCTILFLLVVVVSYQGYGQTQYVDSLQLILQNTVTTREDRVMTLGRLADVMRFYDKPGAEAYSNEAVTLAKALKDNEYLAYAFGYRSNVYASMRELGKMATDLDSAVQYATLSGKDKVNAWAWYQKGRMLDRENKLTEAIAAQFKALEYIKGKKYWSEEAAIYYALYGVYSQWEDLDNEDKYSRMALRAAQKSGDPNKLCESWQARAISLEYRYKKTQERYYLDSALLANRKAIAIYQQHERNMLMEQLMAIPCINMANLYHENFSKFANVSDSILHYAHLAQNYSVKSRNLVIQASVFGVLNEDAKRRGDFKAAEQYLFQALSLIQSDPLPNYYLMYNIHRDLATIAESRKDYQKAFEYQKAAAADYKELYDMEQANAGKEMEAKYEAREKEQQIQFLKEREAMHQKEKYLYAGIGVALFAGLLFMFRSYHFKLRYSMQREKILEKEKEEARLQAKLKEEEALLAAAEQQKAELYARLQEERARLKAEEAARLEAEQKVMRTQQQVLQKEVLAGTLQVEQKNNVLNALKKQFEENNGKEIKASELNKVLKHQQYADNSFEELKTELKEIHPEFYVRLQQRAGNKLTNLDLKYCAYIYLKRSTLEIANAVGVETKSIRMSKYRIKQKLGLGKDEDLDNYILYGLQTPDNQAI